MAQYISKSALVAEIKGYISNYKEIVAKTNRNDSTWVDSVSMIDAKIDVLQHVLFFLDTLEAKEIGVDLGDPKCDIGVKTVWDSSNSLEISRNGNSRNGDDLEEAAIKYGNCFEKHSDLASMAFIKGAKWGKEQAEIQIKAQSMALPHGCPKEKPISEELEEAAWLYYDKNRLSIPPEWNLHKEFVDFFKAGAQWQKSKDESSTEDLEEVSKKYSSCIYLEEVLSDDDIEVLKEKLINTFKAGAKWQKENLWKPADGDDLPEVDREVIALVEENEHYKVVFAHRPSEYWDGKNIITNEVTRHEPKRYDKGGWNQPNVKWWLDLDLPKMEE